MTNDLRRTPNHSYGWQPPWDIVFFKDEIKHDDRKVSSFELRVIAKHGDRIVLDVKGARWESNNSYDTSNDPTKAGHQYFARQTNSNH